MRVIDSHVHFPEPRIIDPGTEAARGAASEKAVGYTSGRSGESAHPWIEAEKARWEAAWRFPAPVEVTKEEGESLWLEEIAKHDFLERVVFVTAGSNAFASELAGRNPGKLACYAHHDPLLPDAAQRLERAVKEGGLSGYKILGPKVDRRLDDRSLDPIWECAQSLGIPVLIHFGIMGGAGGDASHPNISPLAIHDAAKRFPRLVVIVPHFGCGYVFETLNLCWACPNVMIDTSGSNQWMRWMPYEISLESLFRKYGETIGSSRILFGTDSSWFPRGFAKAYLDAQVRAMADVGYREEETDAVLYRNAAALLRLPA
jgi:predicted TIM-barrel fold metal-dependent hydrolase